MYYNVNLKMRLGLAFALVFISIVIQTYFRKVALLSFENSLRRTQQTGNDFNLSKTKHLSSVISKAIEKWSFI